MAQPPRSVQSFVVGRGRALQVFPRPLLCPHRAAATAAAEFLPPFTPFETLLAGSGQEWQSKEPATRRSIRVLVLMDL